MTNALAKSLTGEELACQLIVSLSTELGLISDMLLACMHRSDMLLPYMPSSSQVQICCCKACMLDRTSVNSAVVHTLNFFFS